ncbi:MAG: thiamine-monophosphate kinase [Candidatus Omnitrophica bacterium]|nr:thiamine-monophosphate kinase [Candidatus Omnitrophota bacterium]
MTLSQLGEFGLIERLKPFQNLSRKVVRGMGDDAAVLELDAKRRQLFTTDMCVEGVHFLRTMPAQDVGWKAMAVNVSDIAAMGGTPTFAVVSLGVPIVGPDRGLPPAAPFRPRPAKDGPAGGREPASGVARSGIEYGYLEALYKGIHACARTFGVSIVGGDTVRAPALTINVALLGEVGKKDLVFRSGANPGDVIFVTGPLGGSFKSGRHLTFMPCVKEAHFLVKKFQPSAMMDISDGLVGDLGHILEQSKVGAVLEETRIPVNRGATFEQALYEGEDFELLFTLPWNKAQALIRQKRFYPVGVVVHRHEGLTLRRVDGEIVALTKKAFAHF